MEINKDDAMTELLELAIAELKKLPDAHKKDLSLPLLRRGE